jgi:hypothetical protein
MLWAIDGPALAWMIRARNRHYAAAAYRAPAKDFRSDPDFGPHGF